MSELWKELHIRSLQLKEEDITKYLLEFSNKIPRYTIGCKCREFWILWVRNNPPDFKNFFNWTVKGHNAVNQKLNKPLLTVEEARKLYTLS